MLSTRLSAKDVKLTCLISWYYKQALLTLVYMNIALWITYCASHLHP